MFLFSRVKMYLAAAGAFFAALFVAYWRGRQDEAGAAYERELNEYVETRRRMGDATIPHDADDALDWLRKRESERDLRRDAGKP